MKILAGTSHDPGVASSAPLPAMTWKAGVPAEAGAVLDFNRIYEEWFDEVVRWARALGGPDADLDDITQEVFVVVGRKLPGFDGRNLAGWLYRITARTVSGERRRAWFRRVLRGGRGEADLDGLQHRGPGPVEDLERREAQRLLYRLLGKMSERHRSALVLFEIEGYSGEEIAALLGVPAATVFTRLHHARKELSALCARLEPEER